MNTEAFRLVYAKLTYLLMSDMTGPVFIVFQRGETWNWEENFILRLSPLGVGLGGGGREGGSGGRHVEDSPTSHGGVALRHTPGALFAAGPLYL